jgi:ammonium transporter, Amt family
MHMRPVRCAAGLLIVLTLTALFPLTALAADSTPVGWPGAHLQAAALAMLAPLALILLAVGATPPDEASETVATALSALVLGLVAYWACGFAFQFGGLALRVGWPGLAGLTAEWSPLDPALGLGWGAVGLRGFFLGGAAVTSDAFALAAAQLPFVALAVLIPTLALARRVSRPVLLGATALIGGLLYPLVGNWVWGGGWLAMLGVNGSLGHGFVDLAGSATLHVLGAAAALAGILIFGRGRDRDHNRPADLPPAHFPVFVLLGALLAPIGWWGLVLANPLVTPDLSLGLVGINLVLAAMGGAAPALLYSWLATGRCDALLASRGLVAGLVAASAACAFIPPWAALAVGVLVGILLPALLYLVDYRLGWHDPNAILVTHGLPGLIGALWLALFADGRWGMNWNGVASNLGPAPQGVAGLVVATGLVSDVPGQLYAQLAGLGSILALAFIIPVGVFGLVVGVQALVQWIAGLVRRAPAA